MRRIILTVSLAAAMCAWWAIPALAGCFSQPVVCAPASHNTPGNSHSQSPGPSQRAELPNNQGTQNAAEHSPAIENGFCGFN